jgi:hypothetical protein
MSDTNLEWPPSAGAGALGTADSSLLSLSCDCSLEFQWRQGCGGILRDTPPQQCRQGAGRISPARLGAWTAPRQASYRWLAQPARARTAQWKEAVRAGESRRLVHEEKRTLERLQSRRSSFGTASRSTTSSRARTCKRVRSINPRRKHTGESIPPRGAADAEGGDREAALQSQQAMSRASPQL